MLTRFTGALALVTILCAAVPLAAQTNPLREAEQLVAARDYIAAARVLRAHLEREPGDLAASTPMRDHW